MKPIKVALYDDQMDNVAELSRWLERRSDVELCCFDYAVDFIESIVEASYRPQIAIVDIRSYEDGPVENTRLAFQRAAEMGLDIWTHLDDALLKENKMDGWLEGKLYGIGLLALLRASLCQHRIAYTNTYPDADITGGLLEGNLANGACKKDFHRAQRRITTAIAEIGELEAREPYAIRVVDVNANKMRVDVQSTLYGDRASFQLGASSRTFRVLAQAKMNKRKIGLDGLIEAVSGTNVVDYQFAGRIEVAEDQSLMKMAVRDNFVNSMPSHIPLSFPLRTGHLQLTGVRAGYSAVVSLTGEVAKAERSDLYKRWEMNILNDIRRIREKFEESNLGIKPEQLKGKHCRCDEPREDIIFCGECFIPKTNRGTSGGYGLNAAIEVKSSG